MFKKLKEYKHCLNKYTLEGIFRGLYVSFVIGMVLRLLSINTNCSIFITLLCLGLYSFALFAMRGVFYTYKATKTTQNVYKTIGLYFGMAIDQISFVLFIRFDKYMLLFGICCFVALLLELYRGVGKINNENEATKNLPTTDGYVSGGEDYIAVDFMPFSEGQNHQEFFDLQQKIIQKEKLTEEDLTEFTKLALALHPLQLQSLVLTKQGIYRYYFKNEEQAKAFLMKNQPSN